jgi:hypothetical protein
MPSARPVRPISRVKRSIDAALLATRTGSQGDDPARPGEAAVAAASSTEPQNAVATPKNKKAQKSARGQNHRRDPYRYGAPSWREVRVDDWAARGYAPREPDYQRGRLRSRGLYTQFLVRWVDSSRIDPISLSANPFGPECGQSIGEPLSMAERPRRRRARRVTS